MIDGGDALRVSVCNLRIHRHVLTLITLTESRREDHFQHDTSYLVDTVTSKGHEQRRYELGTHTWVVFVRCCIGRSGIFWP